MRDQSPPDFGSLPDDRRDWHYGHLVALTTPADSAVLTAFLWSSAFIKLQAVGRKMRAAFHNRRAKADG